MTAKKRGKSFRDHLNETLAEGIPEKLQRLLDALE